MQTLSLQVTLLRSLQYFRYVIFLYAFFNFSYYMIIELCYWPDLINLFLFYFRKNLYMYIDMLLLSRKLMFSCRVSSRLVLEFFF
jgi:hypothetical protein